MSNVEKYGLLVLFILCAVIVGVGVFGDGGQPKAAIAPKSGVRVPSQDVENASNVAAQVPVPEGRSGERGTKLEPVPPSRPKGLAEDPGQESAPHILERKPDGDGKAGGSKPEAKPEPKPAAPKKYRVQKGDNLEKLSQQFYGSKAHIELIARANGMKVDDTLFADREIVIPPAPAPAHAPAKGDKRDERKAGETAKKISGR